MNDKIKKENENEIIETAAEDVKVEEKKDEKKPSSNAEEVKIKDKNIKEVKNKKK